MSYRVLLNQEIYTNFLLNIAIKAKKSLWITTGVSTNFLIQLEGGKRYRLSEVLLALNRKRDVRVISGLNKDKSRLLQRLSECNHELIKFCPKMHGKMIIVDNYVAYIGSGNLTAAGMGRPDVVEKNWEIGVQISDKESIYRCSKFFLEIWNDKYCSNCEYKKECNNKTMIL